MSRAAASLQALLEASFSNQIDNMYTSIPCVVVAVRNNGNGAMVDIQPTVNQKFVDGTVSERSAILGVPVSFPMSGSAGVSFPIKVGTTGLAIFSMRSIETWKNSSGGFSVPNNRAKFDKSDAVFFPGIQPPSVNLTQPSMHTYPHSNEDTVVFNNIGTGAENEVRLKGDGTIVINTASKVVANAADVEVNSSTSTINSSSVTVNASDTVFNSNVSVNGMFNYNGEEYSTHTHGGVSTGNGTTGPKS